MEKFRVLILFLDLGGKNPAFFEKKCRVLATSHMRKCGGGVKSESWLRVCLDARNFNSLDCENLIAWNIVLSLVWVYKAFLWEIGFPLELWKDRSRSFFKKFMLEKHPMRVCSCGEHFLWKMRKWKWFVRGNDFSLFSVYIFCDFFFIYFLFLLLGWKCSL